MGKIYLPISLPLPVRLLLSTLSESNYLCTARKGLPVGDYTLQGMEEELAIERKTLPDLVNSIIQDRKDFIEKCERLSAFKKKCLVIEGSLSSIKAPYEDS
jgi:ERCC4-type nuclease